MKIFKNFVFIFVVGILFLLPYSTNALNNKVASCEYKFENSNGKLIELKYDIYSNGEVKTPFSDGTLYARDGKSWYHSDNFSKQFYNASKINSSTITCPTIGVQDSNLGVTVYAYPIYRDSCSGHCYNVSVGNMKLTNWAEDKSVKSRAVVSTCAAPSMGFFNSKSYIMPYFRLLDNGTKQWSLDGNQFFSVADTISAKINGEKFSISVNDSLINTVFNSNSTSCPTQMYRCVVQDGDTYSYELSRDARSCKRDELSTVDGQEFGSQYANGAFGEPDEESSSDDNEHGSNSFTQHTEDLTIEDLEGQLEFGDEIQDCDSLLGSTEDEESVAWLLQQVLNYVKILGPILVVILSSIDFAKSIIASDDENMKKAEKKLVVRLILAVALFLIPTLVSVLLNVFGITTDTICVLN